MLKDEILVSLAVLAIILAKLVINLIKKPIKKSMSQSDISNPSTDTNASIESID